MSSPPLTLTTSPSARKSDAIMTLNLSHFSAALIFSLCASVVFGITQRDNTRQMIRYGLYCFAWFIGGVLLAGWVMWFIKR
jgi:hypothetical protein